jgi:hypothetical protein
MDSGEIPMATNPKQTVPSLDDLPATLRRQGAISLEIEEGVVVLRASKIVLNRIESLLRKNRTAKLTSGEQRELEQYEQIDDYLSLLNRLSRNLARSQKPKEAADAP